MIVHTNKDFTDFKADIGLMQTVYGILLVLGFRLLAETTYLFIEQNVVIGFETASIIAFGIALLFLGFRFFWAVGNIRRYAIRRLTTFGIVTKRWITTFYFPVLVVQAAFFFLLCQFHQDLLNPGLFSERVHQLEILTCIFLSLNAVWLLSLIWPSYKSRPESVWILNNCLISSCLIISWRILSYLQVSSPVILFIASAWLLLNSFVDLWITAPSYIADYKDETKPNK